MNLKTISMKQQIHFGNDARERLRDGVITLAGVVRSTLGPSGHEVILDLEPGKPYATKDGVSIAKSINLDDPIENVGAQLLKQASIKTGEEAGDGTTTATVLANQMFLCGIENQVRNSVMFRKGMEKAGAEVIEFLRTKVSRAVSNVEELKHIATISANGDLQIGELVSRALDEVGQDGAITVEESKSGETYLDVVEGVQFRNGYKSPYFVTDNETMTAVLEDVVIFMADKRFTQVKDLLPMLNGVAMSNKSLLIIADDVEGEALAALVMNKARGILKVCVVKAPGFGDNRKLALEDIAVLTGGTVFSTDKGMKLGEQFNPDWFGTAKKVTVSRDETTIIGPGGADDAISKRIEDIKHQIDESKSNYDKEQLQTRLARLAGGVAVMYAGGHTEIEMKEKKDRIDDALHATRAALEEGICPGGGRALRVAAETVAHRADSNPNQDFQAGYNAVIIACYVPFAAILQNAGYTVEQCAEFLDKLPLGDYWRSVDPTVGRIVDMYDQGIVDPTKVIRLALRNAISVAGTMITSEAVVANIPEETPAADSGVGPMMM